MVSIPATPHRSRVRPAITAGETIEDVAREYHVSATELAFVNQLSAGSDLSGTESLIVPVAAAPSASITRSTRYTAKKGDTLVTVADRFNVSVDELRGWNHLKGTTLTPGHTLYVSEPARVASSHGHRRGSSATRSTKGTAKTASSASGKTKTSSSSTGTKHHSSGP